MSDSNDSRPTPLGIYDRPQKARVTGIEIIAVSLSLLWLAGTAVFFLVLMPEEGAAGFDGLRFLMTLLAIFMPVAMIWVAATAAKSSRVMREESQRLQSAIDAMRQTYVAQLQGQGARPEIMPSVARKLDEIAEAQKKTESAIATFATKREPTYVRKTPEPEAPPSDGATQPVLELGTQASDFTPPLERADFIRAMNFPETAEDEQGFVALRKALKDREASLLIRASQDVLTLLSQDGIYMDDMRPDKARPEIWRKFGDGERGRSVAALGGIRDRSSLALAAGRMKKDPIFRDAVHHFLRMFDKIYSEFAKTASDTEISAMADTRTARAFMLLGRIAGTFD